MKKIFTLTAICALLFSASVTAQDFPSDPGTLMVDLELIAADFSSGDTIANQAPEGSGAYASAHEDCFGSRHYEQGRHYPAVYSHFNL